MDLPSSYCAIFLTKSDPVVADILLPLNRALFDLDTKQRRPRGFQTDRHI